VLQAERGLTLTEVVRDLPHDGPSLVVYTLVLLFVAMIWVGSRKRPT
jgi:hypothetical protein